MSRISVIIPTYNRSDKLGRSVRSVLAQTCHDFRLIIVDDASTDDTKERIEALKDERILYRRLDKNSGAAAARAEGVRLADTEFIAFHDSDDVWMPYKLEKQLEYMDEHPEAGMVYGRIRVISPEKTFVFPNDSVEGELQGDLYPWLLKRNTIDAPTMFLRKKDYDEAGGFDPSLRCLEDWEFALRFSKGRKIGFVDEVLMDSYVTEGGVSMNKAAYYETRCKMISMHRQALTELGLFDEVVMDVFNRAQNSGVLPQVQKMLMTALQA